MSAAAALRGRGSQLTPLKLSVKWQEDREVQRRSSAPRVLESVMRCTGATGASSPQTSTRYPVTADPYTAVGAAQVTSSEVTEEEVGGKTEGLPTGPGAPAGARDGGVEELQEPAPTLFKARTAKERAVPGMRPVMSAERRVG